MSSKALDKESHSDDEAYAHEQNAVPIRLKKTNVKALQTPISSKLVVSP